MNTYMTSQRLKQLYVVLLCSSVIVVAPPSPSAPSEQQLYPQLLAEQAQSGQRNNRLGDNPDDIAALPITPSEINPALDQLKEYLLAGYGKSAAALYYKRFMLDDAHRQEALPIILKHTNQATLKKMVDQLEHKEQTNALYDLAFVYAGTQHAQPIQKTIDSVLARLQAKNGAKGLVYEPYVPETKPVTIHVQLQEGKPAKARPSFFQWLFGY